MRQLLAVAAVIATTSLAAPPSAGARPRPPRAHAAQTALQRSLSAEMRRTGKSSSAYALDLTTGQVLFSWSAAVPRLPASVEKLYTTSTALLRFGPNARLSTSVYGTGSLGADGTWNGNLYLRGGGDPTFGSAAYDRYAYGGGATMQALVSNLLNQTGIRAVQGAIVGDESRFDSDRGTPATGNRPNLYIEGQLSALVYDRGLANPQGSAFQTHPAVFTAAAFASALKAAGVRLPAKPRVYAGRTPTGAEALGSVRSPKMATLIRWTNTPSDNFFAETLLKDLGAEFGGTGTTAAGVAVAKAQLATSFGVSPAFDDGSGLSYADHTSPLQVVTLLDKMSANPYFVSSLAVAGVSGTLQYEMNGTVAQGRCRGKTGTLQAVSNLVGYCQAENGDTIAFAFLMNRIDPYYAHPIQNAMVEDLAASSG
jgi:D-alanyl-D-alanine carboxypeptidase/D-alanyl-D-alanine-endopeptidase (penicillin-binding protein 4)